MTTKAIEAVRKAVTYRFGHDHPVRRAAKYISIVLSVSLFVVGYKAATWKETRIEAAKAKFQSIDVFDSASNVGIVLVKGDKVIRWTRGMTDLFGWSSRDMLGQTLDRLAHEADKKYVSKLVFRRQTNPALAYGLISLQHKNGHSIELFCEITDPDSDSSLRKLTFLGVHAVEPLEELLARAKQSPDQVDVTNQTDVTTLQGMGANPFSSYSASVQAK